MDEAILKTDKHSKIKKTTISIFVITVGLLAIIVFLMFGKLLRDFLIFDINRTQANDELSILSSRIKEYENQIKTQRESFENELKKRKEQLGNIYESIIKRQNQIDSQQKSINEYNELIKRIDSSKKEYLASLDELKIVREKVTEEKSFVSENKTEVSMLTTQKLSLQNELAELYKNKKTSEQSIAQLSNQIKELEKNKFTTQTEVSEAKKALTKASEDLISPTKKLENTRKELSQLEGETDKLKTTLSSLSGQRALIQETIKAKTMEKEEMETAISRLVQQKTELSGAIAPLAERKRDMEAQVKAMEITLEQTKARLQLANKEIEAAKTDK